MANTTNYSWETPDDTDLVKDGAAAIRTLGSAIDTTTKNLNPSTTLGDIEYRSSTANTNTRLGIGTSGQALTVVAGVPSWAASPTSVLTTTGDVLYASAANTLARLGIGSTGNVLTVSGGVPSWAAPASSLAVAQIATGSLSSTQVSITGLSSYNYLVISFYNFGLDSGSTTSSGYSLTINSDSGSNYNVQGWGFRRTNTFNNSLANTDKGQSNTYIDLSCGAGDFSATGNNGQIFIVLENCKASGFTSGSVQSFGSWYDSGTLRGQYGSSQFLHKSAAAVSSIELSRTGSGNFNSGTYTVWGA